MHDKNATSALGQHLEIAARLRCLDNAKRVRLFRHLEIIGVVAGDLQEHAAVGAAFVDLTGRMQEARPKPETGGDPLAPQ